jgi:hypothetical protein
MKIDLQSVDRNNFMVHEHIVNGEVLSLIQPIHIGAVWTQENKIFRSSVWNALGELVSAGFPKFVNMGEKPEVFPPPQSLNGTVIVDKLDGSLLIVSKYKGNYILRTRGTVDAFKLDNGYELEIFKQTILPKLIFDFDASGPDSRFETWPYSFLFEWVSPKQRIVLSYGDTPDWYLVGAVNHEDYSLFTQKELDTWAEQEDIQVKRPATYTFNTIEDLISNVDKWVDREGVCLYSKNGQEIHKIKAARYLFLHRMKSELSSLEKVLDVWLNQNKPSYTDFYNYISATFDYELAEQCKGLVSQICDGYKEVLKIVVHMKGFVEPLKNLPRKDAALKILSAYGETNRKSFCFNLLDSREIDNDGIKKLMFQVLK